MLQIDYRDKRPIYTQLIDHVSTMIVQGAWPQDHQLPSVRSLALELSINPNTIQRAYGDLESRGVIYSVKGRGSFVSDKADQLRQEQINKLYQTLRETKHTLLNLGVDLKSILRQLEMGESI